MLCSKLDQYPDEAWGILAKACAIIDLVPAMMTLNGHLPWGSAGAKAHLRGMSPARQPGWRSATFFYAPQRSRYQLRLVFGDKMRMTSTPFLLPGWDCRHKRTSSLLFPHCLGYVLPLTNFRLGLFGGSPSSSPETITINHLGRIPHNLSLKYVGVVRILGFHFSLDCSHSYQLMLTKQRVQLACSAMTTATRSSPPGVAMTAAISCLARAAYSGQVGAWTQKDLLALETPLNILLRRLFGFRPSTDTNLLYMATSHGGMGFSRLYDYVQKLVHRSLLLRSTSSSAMGG